MFVSKLASVVSLQHVRSLVVLLSLLLHFLRAEFCIRLLAVVRISGRMATTSWQWLLAAFDLYDSDELEDEELFSSIGESAELRFSSSAGRRVVEDFQPYELLDAASGGCNAGPRRRGSFSQLSPTEEVIMNLLERTKLEHEAVNSGEDAVAMLPQCIWPLIAYQQTIVAAFWIKIFRFLLPSRKSLVEERTFPEDSEQPVEKEDELSVVSFSEVNNDCIIWSASKDSDDLPSTVQDAAAEQYYSVPQLAPLSPSDAPFDSSKLLPPLRHIHLKRKTLVLDLDETLIHSVFTPIMHADFVINLDVDGKLTTIYVHKRPGVEEFLRAVAQVYEVVIFTASMASYANALVNLLDPDGSLVHHRLFRDSCIWWRNSYVKDLTMLGRDLSKTMIVDNSPLSYAFQPENGVPILSYYDEQGDRELAKLAPFLLKLASVEDDVRLHLGGMGSINIL